MILEEFARKQIQTTAEQLGFNLLGFTPAKEAATFPQLCNWLENGYAASMHYIERRKDAYRHPESILPNCKSLAVLARPYPAHPWTIRNKSDRTRPLSTDSSVDPKQLNLQNTGTIGSYASPHCDYHTSIRNDLKPLLAELKKMFPVVDRKKHPFTEQKTRQLFLPFRDPHGNRSVQEHDGTGPCPLALRLLPSLHRCLPN